MTVLNRFKSYLWQTVSKFSPFRKYLLPYDFNKNAIGSVTLARIRQNSKLWNFAQCNLGSAKRETTSLTDSLPQAALFYSCLICIYNNNHRLRLAPQFNIHDLSYNFYSFVESIITINGYITNWESTWPAPSWLDSSVGGAHVALVSQRSCVRIPFKPEFVLGLNFTAHIWGHLKFDGNRFPSPLKVLYITALIIMCVAPLRTTN